MKKKPIFDWGYIVNWIIFCSVVMFVVGVIIQLVRWGAWVESGSIGPTGW